jgi:cysteine-rich CPCC protein
MSQFFAVLRVRPSTCLNVLARHDREGAGHHGLVEAYGHMVELRLPRMDQSLVRRLDAALHAADRRIGVSTGRTEDGEVRLIIYTDEADPDRAVERARQALAEAGAAGAALIEVGRLRLSPGRPRRVEARDDLPYWTLDLPDGRVLRAAHEGPMGDWVVAVGYRGEAWRGRSLVSVLHQALELPWGRVDDWVADVIRRLAGRETPKGIRYDCPCCDEPRLAEPPPGTFEICKVCGWEDDNVQFDDPDYKGGANHESLRQARAAFRASDPHGARP